MSLIDIDKLLEVIVPDQKSTDKKKQVGLYAGGFKPPTSGHFKVVMKALRDNPDLDELKILIGNKDRDGVTQAQSMLIWDIYKKYLPFKVTLEPVSKPPVKAVYNYAKENPDEDVDWILGAREGNEDDFKDIATRTTAADNYPNLTVRTTITDSGASGTAARNAFKVSQEKLEKLLPKKLDQLEKDEVFKILTRVDESVNEGDTYEKMAAKGKKAGNLKQGTVRKRLNIPKGEKIPLTKIKKEISRIKKMENPSEKNKKYLKALNLAKTLKTTTNLSSKKENIDPKAQAKHKGKSAPYGSAYEPVVDEYVLAIYDQRLLVPKVDFFNDKDQFIFLTAPLNGRFLSLYSIEAPIPSFGSLT